MTVSHVWEDLQSLQPWHRHSLAPKTLHGRTALMMVKNWRLHVFHVLITSKVLESCIFTCIHQKQTCCPWVHDRMLTRRRPNSWRGPSTFLHNLDSSYSKIPPPVLQAAGKKVIFVHDILLCKASIIAYTVGTREWADPFVLLS